MSISIFCIRLYDETFEILSSGVSISIGSRYDRYMIMTKICDLCVGYLAIILMYGRRLNIRVILTK